MMEVLTSDSFWFGAIVGAVVIGWLAAFALGSYKKTLRLKAESPHQTAEKLGDRFYYLVEESDYNQAFRNQMALAACAGEFVQLRDELEQMTKRKDGAYEERNKVVSALARLFPSGVARTAIEGWSEDWHGCVYIDLPTGQVSWHFHDSQAALFAGLPPYTKEWDGHSTEEKYRRLAALAELRFAHPYKLDVSGQPKLELTLLERHAVDTLNLVKAWCESDRSSPFPEQAHMGADLVIGMAQLRRVGVA